MLREAKQKVSVVIWTDGVPDKRKAFEKALRELMRYPVSVTVRLCTSDEVSRARAKPIHPHPALPLPLLPPTLPCRLPCRLPCTLLLTLPVPLTLTLTLPLTLTLTLTLTLPLTHTHNRTLPLPLTLPLALAFAFPPGTSYQQVTTHHSLRTTHHLLRK